MKTATRRDELTLSLFNTTLPAGMERLARAYAQRWGWRFVAITSRRDLVGTSYRAIFLDSANGERERTIDDLRVQGPPPAFQPANP